MSLLNKSLRIMVATMAIAASCIAPAEATYIDINADVNLRNNFQETAICGYECRTDLIEISNAFLDALENGQRSKEREAEETKNRIETSDNNTDDLSYCFSTTIAKIYMPAAFIAHDTSDVEISPDRDNHYTFT